MDRLTSGGRTQCKLKWLCIIAALALLPAMAAPGQAQETSSRANSRGIQFSFSAAPFFQSRADLDRGGEFSLNHYMVRGNAIRSASDSILLGLSVGYDCLDFEFSGPSAFAGARPWSKVHRLSLSLPIFYQADTHWRLSLAPSVDWSGESGADLEKALRYGVAVSAAYRFSPNLSFGAGVGIFYGMEETRAFPFLSISWKISKDWLLSNPLSAGPIGPAGLELIYSPSDLWEVGGGGAYRANRFRLDDKGAAPDGIGQLSGWPVWIRISRNFNRRFRLDLYGGVLLSGELRIEDRDGRRLDSDDFNPAAFMAANLSAKF